MYRLIESNPTSSVHNEGLFCSPPGYCLFNILLFYRNTIIQPINLSYYYLLTLFV